MLSNTQLSADVVFGRGMVANRSAAINSVSHRCSAVLFSPSLCPSLSLPLYHPSKDILSKRKVNKRDRTLEDGGDTSDKFRHLELMSRLVVAVVIIFFLVFFELLG